MSRPQYESLKDRAAEDALMLRVFPELPYYKLPMRYQLDFMVEQSGGRMVWVECKQRSVPWGTYDTYLLSLEKYLAGVRLARTTGGAFVLVTGWSDGRVMVANLNCCLPSIYRVVQGGRIDRNDDQDREPVILIPSSHFASVP